jgi:hypothetical protein
MSHNTTSVTMTSTKLGEDGNKEEDDGEEEENVVVLQFV